MFHLKERKTNVKTEIIAGLITFIAMCYVLPVNTSILGAMGMDKGGVFAMTALMSCAVTLIMALVANYPVVSSGSGRSNCRISRYWHKERGIQAYWLMVRNYCWNH